MGKQKRGEGTEQAIFRRKNLDTRKEILASGFIAIPSALGAKDPGLSVYERVLYGVLLSFVRPKGGGRCNPATETLAAYCGFSERQVELSRTILQKHFWLTWKRTGRSNFYRMFSPSEHDEIARLSANARRKTKAAQESED